MAPQECVTGPGVNERCFSRIFFFSKDVSQEYSSSRKMFLKNILHSRRRDEEYHSSSSSCNTTYLADLNSFFVPFFSDRFQTSGEIFYFPDSWHHATLNVADTIGIAFNHVPPPHMMKADVPTPGNMYRNRIAQFAPDLGLIFPRYLPRSRYHRGTITGASRRLISLSPILQTRSLL